MNSTSDGVQKGIICGIKRGKLTRAEAEKSLDELERLVDTSGGVVIARSFQDVRRADPATFIGSGKVEELAALVAELKPKFVVIDDELSPVQNRNLEEELKTLVFDRTTIILDIFAMRAHSREGKYGIELAQLEYLGSRLSTRGEGLSQQTGGIGTRGPGETKLEVDRRRIKDRINFLHNELAGLKSHRKVHRSKREAGTIPLVTLVGYTNAGKSTLMNALTDAQVLVEDKLFATLDPTVRRMKLPSGRIALLADTVGFIRRLPHELVQSFKSTFEEVSHSSLLLHVIDGSDDDAPAHVKIVGEVLNEIGLGGRTQIEVINKGDVGELCYGGTGSAVRISAAKKMGLDLLLQRIDDELAADLKRLLLFIPHSRGDILSDIYVQGHVISVSHEEEGTLVECELNKKQVGKFKEFCKED